MVLAAGLGERMRPLSLLRAKPALPVLNRPLIQWTLEKLARHGVRDVVINLHHLPATVKAALKELPAARGKRRTGASALRITYSREMRLLGTGGGPRKARAFFGAEPFLLVNGDIAFDFDLQELVRAFRRERVCACLGLLPNPDRKRYTPVYTNPRGRIVAIGGRPRARSYRAYLFTGVQLLDARLLDRLPPGKSDIVRDLYLPLLEEGEAIQGVKLKGAWYDFGSPSLYLASQLSMLDSGSWGARGRFVYPSARVHPRADVGRSVIGPGSRVDRGARVVGSVLWDRVRVGEGAEVRDSIVASGAWVKPHETVRGMVVSIASHKSGPKRRRLVEAR